MLTDRQVSFPYWQQNTYFHFWFPEEELKRLHAAGYGQVGFNYDTPVESKTESQAVEIEEPFEASPVLKALLPEDMVLVWAILIIYSVFNYTYYEPFCKRYWFEMNHIGLVVSNLDHTPGSRPGLIPSREKTFVWWA